MGVVSCRSFTQIVSVYTLNINLYIQAATYFWHMKLGKGRSDPPPQKKQRQFFGFVGQTHDVRFRYGGDEFSFFTLALTPATSSCLVSGLTDSPSSMPLEGAGISELSSLARPLSSFPLQGRRTLRKRSRKLSSSSCASRILRPILAPPGYNTIPVLTYVTWDAATMTGSMSSLPRHPVRGNMLLPTV